MAAKHVEILGTDSEAVYRHALAALHRAGIEFLVGGTYGLESITGIVRHTKDLDIFVRPPDYERVAAALEKSGFQSTLTYPHWLGKAHWGDAFIDIIFSSGNGVATIDDEWFRHAAEAVLLGVPIMLCPPEETIWSKAFIMERERYDGADIAHIIRHSGPRLDWKRLLLRFGDHWRVLFSHLILFGYIYPAERAMIPDWVMFGLVRRMLAEIESQPADGLICRGTFLSRAQYIADISEWGYEDGRVASGGTMTPEDAACWSEQAES